MKMKVGRCAQKRMRVGTVNWELNLPGLSNMCAFINELGYISVILLHDIYS